MSSVVISGNTSGSITLSAPDVSGSNTATLPAATGTVMVSGNMPAFSVYRSGNQTLTNNVVAKIAFNAKNFDTANCFDSTTNYRFTPTVGGYYQINWVMQISGLVNARNYAASPMIYKNGSRVIGYEFDWVQYNDTIGLTLNWFGLLNGSTDYIEAYIYYNDGTAGATANLTGSTTNSMFTGSMVRAA